MLPRSLLLDLTSLLVAVVAIAAGVVATRGVREGDLVEALLLFAAAFALLRASVDLARCAVLRRSQSDG